jgi:hypothetical protein
MRLAIPFIAALALSFVPAPASSALVDGPMAGIWEFTLHAKTHPFSGEKAFNEVLTASAQITDSTPTGASTVIMTGNLGQFLFTLQGYRINKHFFMFESQGGAITMWSGDVTIPKSTGVAKTLKGRGTLANLAGISDFTITGKRVGP